LIETDYYKIWIADDVVHVLYKEGTIIGLDTAKQLVASRLKLQDGKIYNGMAHVNNIRAFHKDASKYLAVAGYEGVNKVALIVQSAMTIQIGNLFILINKPPKPTKLFKNKEDALKWLKS
jgi:hypothetical protein